MRALICVAIIVATTPRPADACSCARIDPCEAYWEADFVFTGEVTNIVKKPKFEKDAGGRYIIGGPTQTVTIAVTEKFRGAVGDTMTVEAGGSCGTELVGSETYFIYAVRKGAKLVIEGCSRTDKIADAAPDLAYARALPNRALGVVEGNVQRMTDDDSDKPLPVQGVIVRVQGSKTFASLPTDARGHYRLDVPPGTHTLDVDGPTFRIGGTPPSITLASPAACAAADLEVIWSGRARGRLLDHLGKPASGIRVVARNTSKSWSRSAKSKPDGQFEIDGIPPAMSFVVVGAADGPTATQPIHATAIGKTFTLPASNLVEKLELRLPAPLAVYASTGIVRDKRGPVGNVTVAIESDPGDRQWIEADAKGRFTFNHLAANVEFEACIERRGKRLCTTVKKRLDGPSAIDIVVK